MSVFFTWNPVIGRGTKPSISAAAGNSQSRGHAFSILIRKEERPVFEDPLHSREQCHYLLFQTWREPVHTNRKCRIDAIRSSLDSTSEIACFGAVAKCGREHVSKISDRGTWSTT